LRARLPALSSRQLIAALRGAGFEEAPRRGKGSHHALMRREPDSRVRLAVVPERRELPRGTLHAILQQAGLTPEQLADLL
jgi:predicted RNA binding protein YcfA (HicA-like mRNA interferase family)